MMAQPSFLRARYCSSVSTPSEITGKPIRWAEIFCDIDYDADHAGVVLLIESISNKQHIQLKSIDRKLGDHVERRIT